MLKILTLTILALTFTGIAFAAEEGTEKEPSFAEETYAKALDVNTKKTEAAYGAYAKELEVANQAVAKSLQTTIKDLNDPKKFPKLDMKQRANNIEQLEEKISELKKGALSDTVVASWE